MLFLGTAVSSSVGCDVLSLTFSVSVCSESDIGSVFSTFGVTASGSSGISFTGPATLVSKLFTMLLLVSNGLKSGSSSLSKTSKLYPLEGTIISSSFSSSGVSSATLVFGPFLSQGFGGNAFLGFFSVLLFPFFSSSTVSFFTFSIFSFFPSSSSAELLLLATIFPLLSSLTADDSMTGEFSSKLLTTAVLVSNGLKLGSSSLSRKSRLYPFDGTGITSSPSTASVSTFGGGFFFALFSHGFFGSGFLALSTFFSSKPVFVSSSIFFTSVVLVLQRMFSLFSLASSFTGRDSVASN